MNTRCHAPAQASVVCARSLDREENRTLIITSAALLAALGVALFAMIAALATISSADSAHAKTVDCAVAAAPAEFAICNSEDLQLLDQKLDRHFSSMINKASSHPVRQVFKREKNNFLNIRNQCGADMICLEHKYKDALGRVSTRV